MNEVERVACFVRSELVLKDVVIERKETSKSSNNFILMSLGDLAR